MVQSVALRATDEWLTSLCLIVQKRERVYKVRFDDDDDVVSSTMDQMPRLSLSLRCSDLVCTLFRSAPSRSTMSSSREQRPPQFALLCRAFTHL